MDNIDQIAHKNFFVGVLGLMVDLKVKSYENLKMEKEDLLKTLNKCRNHLDLIKQYSPLVSYYVVFFSTVYEFINTSDQVNDCESLLDLFDIFEEFKVFRKFNKE